MGSLYSLLKPQAPGMALIALLFVPVYAAFNLIVYLSQITVVPALLALRSMPEYAPAVTVLLGQALQAWPASAVYVINNLAYALLGIPSIVYGVLLARRGRWFRMGGVLLALNGAACILGVLGILAGDPILSNGSTLGGGLYLLALLALAPAFFRAADLPGQQPAAALARR
jgi:hypothetical protein